MRQGGGRVGSNILGIGVILVSLLPIWSSQGWGAKLEDMLLENKQITVDQWVQLKAEEEKRQAKESEERRGSGDVPLHERWYEKISIRGYTQLRYNYTINNNLLQATDDRSVGGNNEFFLRRGRIIISGQPHNRVFFYFQPEFAGLVGGTEQVGAVRDLYADLFLTESKEWRIRAGLSKIQYGFESMQSSQNRLALDRADAFVSGTPNQRDLGLFLYYTPTAVRERFKRLVDNGLKGSGDYGMLGIGAYNGQGSNVRDGNKNKHVVFHAMYPYEFPNGQIVQVGMDAYTGRYRVSSTPVVPTDTVASLGTALSPRIQDGGNYADERLAWHFVIYPQPFGLQGEYTIGRGPELNPARTEIVTGKISGGYLQFFYNYKCDSYCLNILPYVRYQEYFGGRKSLANAPRDSVRELELGVEYQINKAVELTVAGTFSLRNSSNSQFSPASCATPGFEVACVQTPYQRTTGNLLRFQLQWNF